MAKRSRMVPLLSTDDGETTMEGRRFCSLPDSLTTEEIGARWTIGKVLWAPTAQLPGLTAEQWQAALIEAWGNWGDVCGIVTEPTDTARLANVLHGVGSLGDGPGKTLAWSELPNGSNMRLNQKYDSDEIWAFGNPGRGQIDIVCVACHEIGHALGLGHDTGSGTALMDPYYSAAIRKPQPRDIARIQALYGKPQPAPVPPPMPPPSPGVLTGDEAMAQVESLVAKWKSGR